VAWHRDFEEKNTILNERESKIITLLEDSSKLLSQNNEYMNSISEL